MKLKSIVGIFGGTFDPVHIGHVQMALEAKQRLKLNEVRLIPCHLPPHRETPQQGSQQRLMMLKLAVAGIEGLVTDSQELERDGPSYTVDTLKQLRSELGEDVSLVLIMGADAFARLTQWHHWPEIPVLANIVVLQRPGYQLPESGILADWLKQSTIKQIYEQAAGAVVAIDQMPMELSATAIRRELAAGQSSSDLIPSVMAYIQEHQLYGYKTQEVSP